MKLIRRTPTQLFHGDFVMFLGATVRQNTDKQLVLMNARLYISALKAYTW